MLFTPLLASTTVGTLEFRSITQPVKTAYPDVSFVQGHATSIDTDRKVVKAVETLYGPKGSIEGEAACEVPYDVLAIGIGARNQTFGIPGVTENMHFLKELSDAREIRKAITRNVLAATFPGIAPAERRRLLSFVIVGGGPTGVEFAAELHDFIAEDLLKMYPHLFPDVSITVVEGAKLLGAFDSSLRDYTMKKFQRDKIHVCTGANVVRVEPHTVHLSNGEKLAYGLGVWNTGIGPRPLVAEDKSVFAKDKWGHILTTDGLDVIMPSALAPAPAPSAAPGPSSGSSASTSAAASSSTSTSTSSAASTTTSISSLSKSTYPGIFAMGDCASVGENRYAATAQVAEQQGLWLARRLNDAMRISLADAFTKGASRDAILQRALAFKPPKGFEYHHKGSLAFLGSFRAVSDFTQGAFIKPLYGAKLKGPIAWFTWRSAYLTKLGSWRNRLQVPIDWTRTLIFGRDTTLF